MKTIIISVSHNNNRLPDGTECLPVMAGSALLEASVPAGYIRDDSGENISYKNREYCELTALYWAWKNLDADVLGLCHYRRFFASPVSRKSFLKMEEAEHLLNYYDAVLPKQRDYLLETNYSQYANAHNAADLELTRQIIAERYPEYLCAFDRRMSMTKGHRFNMFIMNRCLVDEYCTWLFDILPELEKRRMRSSDAVKNQRVYGYIAERLLDVWIDKKELLTADLDYIFIGREHLAKKAAAMCGRKLKSWIRQELITH
jgi:hypothetical protein